MSTIFPSALLTLTPLLDIVRLITHDGALAKLAFWSSLLGVLVIAILFIPELIDWLSSDRHTRTRRAGAAPLTMHVAAIAPLALGVYERLHLAAITHAAAVAGAAPTLTKLDAWPMALAVAGGLAWLLGGWMAEEKMERVRYQPTGFPTRA
jgi:uncharacterized membrane protein